VKTKRKRKVSIEVDQVSQETFNN